MERSMEKCNHTTEYSRWVSTIGNWEDDFGYWDRGTESALIKIDENTSKCPKCGEVIHHDV